MSSDVNIAVIGAGPYGLSLGAHLHSSRADYIVFGDPMNMWRTAMPRGMHLKSDGFASNLSDPQGEFPLSEFCAQHSIPYADMGHPMVALETFISYGLEFQNRFVEQNDRRRVISLNRLSRGFLLGLDDGTQIEARKVVMAVGIADFAHVPRVFREVPPEFCTHSSMHVEFDQFSNRRVAVVGGGSSATDVAALLYRAGADVDMITRRAEIAFHQAMRVPRPIHHRIIAPTSGLGPGWRSRFYTDAAPIFRLLPRDRRVAIVRSSFGPAGGWFIKSDVVGKVPIVTNTNIDTVQLHGDRVLMKLRRSDGVASVAEYDHVICATGYRAELDRVNVIDQHIRSQIATVAHTPEISSHFESSVKNLYFVGPISANTFGPMMRFAYGSRFVARRLSPHLQRTE